jgi:chromosome segregation ATPase
MNAKLTRFNLIGVLALAALCAIQWQHDRGLNLELNRSEKARMQQAAKLAEQAQLLDGVNQDLAQLKVSLAKKQGALTQSERELHGAIRTNQVLAAECAQLKAAITNWSRTVNLQNSRIAEANARIEQLAAELNASILKFNGLVTNYNAVVGELNASRATNRVNAVPAPQP